jgi:hypothetical protein
MERKFCCLLLKQHDASKVLYCKTVKCTGFVSSILFNRFLAKDENVFLLVTIQFRIQFEYKNKVFNVLNVNRFSFSFIFICEFVSLMFFCVWMDLVLVMFCHHHKPWKQHFCSFWSCMHTGFSLSFFCICFTKIKCPFSTIERTRIHSLCKTHKHMQTTWMLFWFPREEH